MVIRTIDILINSEIVRQFVCKPLALLYSSDPVSHHSVSVSQHAQYSYPQTAAVKWNSAIIVLFVILFIYCFYVKMSFMKKAYSATDKTASESLSVILSALSDYLILWVETVLLEDTSVLQNRVQVLTAVHRQQEITFSIKVDCMTLSRLWTIHVTYEKDYTWFLPQYIHSRFNKTRWSRCSSSKI